jgi:hypothetical protein
MNKKEEPRTEKIELRVSVKEKNSIAKIASQHDLTISNYARQKLIHGFVFVKTKPEQSVTTDDKFIDRKTLIGLANNLNQLTKYTHQNNVLHPKVEALILEIEKHLFR